MIVSIFSINWINQYYWCMKTLKAFICVGFFSAFRYFLLYTSLLFNTFLMILLTFSQISLYLPNTFYSFIKKYIHLVLSKPLLYILIFGQNMQKGLIFFIVFVINKIFKFLFTKRKLIRYYYFVVLLLCLLLFYYIIYGNRSLYSSILVSSDFIIFYQFLYMVS